MTEGSKRVRIAARIFQYEKELKHYLRERLELVEPGLKLADGGREREVATGKIDITAEDINGNYVVIELKAGTCPTGALEQVMGYSTDLEAETGKPCRAVIVASDFPARIRAAAKRANEVYLVTYQIESMNVSGSALQ